MDLLVHLPAWTGAPPANARCLFRHVQPRRLPDAPGRLVLAGPAALERVDPGLAKAWLSRGARRILLAVDRCEAQALQAWLGLGGVEVVPPDATESALSGVVREL